MLPSMSVEDFLVSDRQWSRYNRWTHANLQKGKASTPEEHEFWDEVLAALGKPLPPVPFK